VNEYPSSSEFSKWSSIKLTAMKSDLSRYFKILDRESIILGMNVKSAVSIALFLTSILLAGCGAKSDSTPLTTLEQACQEFRRGATNMTGGDSTGRAQGHFLSSGRHFKDIESENTKFSTFAETLREVGESLAKDSSGSPLQNPKYETVFREIREFCKQY
jgi:hypothetical protein